MRRTQETRHSQIDVSYIAGESSRKGPILWLILSGVLLIAAIAAGTVITAHSFRERALQAEKRNLQSTVLLLSRHFDQRFDDFSDAPNEVLKQIKPANDIDPPTFRGEAATLRMHELLRNAASHSPDVAGINIFAADGTLINSSEAWPVRDLNVSDRKYFKQLKDGSPDSVQIEVVQGKFTGRWAIVVARRLSGSNGQFFGIVSRALDPSSIAAFFESVALSTGASIGLFHRDGTLLARYPTEDAMIGKNFSASPVHQKILSTSTSGVTELTSPVDGLARIAAARRLDRFPISVIATTRRSMALAEWWDQTKLLIIVATLIAAVIALTLFLIVRRLARQHLATKQQLETAINNITQGLMLYDSAARIVLFNQRYVEMYGLSLTVIKPGRSFREVMQHRKQTGSFDGDPEKFCDDVLQNVKDERLTRRILKTKDGRTIQMVNQPLANGGWVTTHEDISELKRSEQRIERLAHYDALTGLPNRTLFRERLESSIRQADSNSQVALLYIDIDQFKEINDSLGHSVGDDFLKVLAQRFQAGIRGKDFISRLGGDEFAVVRTGVTQRSEVQALVAEIYQSIRDPIMCGGHQLSADASIGVALAPANGTDIDELIRNADLAMYEAKSGGRRTFRFFEPAMDAKARAHREMALDLREAIRTEAFDVYYQPVLDISTYEVCGCEALLRWNHSSKGAISPADFIPIAEDIGLIDELGEWVLKNACREAALWPKQINLAVNVSPVQFRSPTLAMRIIAALAESGLSASRLEIEITEAVLIQDEETILSTLHQLRAVGVRIALDDFGVGYSSLSYLQRFPFDKIKIDRSFVNGLSDESDTSSIVQAVVTIANARNMVTTAEGVETIQQFDRLKELGCTQMQGWLFSAAKPADQVQLFLHSAVAKNSVAS